MQAFLIWCAVIIPSLIWGAFCAYKIEGKYAIYMSAVVPWLALLICLLYTVYFLSYESHDASMRLVAQLFAGTIMAGLGFASYKITSKYTK